MLLPKMDVIESLKAANVSVNLKKKNLRIAIEFLSKRKVGRGNRGGMEVWRVGNSMAF